MGSLHSYTAVHRKETRKENDG
ncbi:unnamed protein product [Arabidopsis thaliana]|uniref:Uncharacterized protein n=2 Tax=Arabidopsis thaliana TaxID=3702 RepID=A0A654ESD9_ARATH|nr:uncharacterized protein AT1G48355 [Arabidopsis thaliana]ANM59135.1 hypothetical protein AT1G48355 [Arabidopsis thaliana]CAA0278531.1 unnamed protein product [Arabidopsis thaliana]VYS48471.1 unnamed protein product [Arabidopsis thaliana]|eukprot:NP_001336508.1 hypothetical protein AT1G48355 [Arabidopsis thaliana]